MPRKMEIITIGILLLLCIGVALFFHFRSKKDNLIAEIYYRDELILTIELYKLEQETQYIVQGDNGEMVILAKKNAIMVEKENSPRHICSIQGWTNRTTRPIICLPNGVYILLKGNTSELDLEV